MDNDIDQIIFWSHMISESGGNKSIENSVSECKQLNKSEELYVSAKN